MLLLKNRFSLSIKNPNLWQKCIKVTLASVISSTEAGVINILSTKCMKQTSAFLFREIGTLISSLSIFRNKRRPKKRESYELLWIYMKCNCKVNIFYVSFLNKISFLQNVFQRQALHLVIIWNILIEFLQIYLRAVLCVFFWCFFWLYNLHCMFLQNVLILWSNKTNFSSWLIWIACRGAYRIRCDKKVFQIPITASKCGNNLLLFLNFSERNEFFFLLEGFLNLLFLLFFLS